MTGKVRLSQYEMLSEFVVADLNHGASVREYFFLYLLAQDHVTYLSI